MIDVMKFGGKRKKELNGEFFCVFLVQIQLIMLISWGGKKFYVIKIQRKERKGKKREKGDR
jgi:hypothetical protein